MDILAWFARLKCTFLAGLTRVKWTLLSFVVRERGHFKLCSSVQYNAGGKHLWTKPKISLVTVGLSHKVYLPVTALSELIKFHPGKILVLQSYCNVLHSALVTNSSTHSNPTLLHSYQNRDSLYVQCYPNSILTNLRSQPN